jgi:uncharacterized protein YecE (DUF72 family)
LKPNTHNQDLVHIGTSGWHYKDWSGTFYPERLPAKGFLEYYTRHFHTVEINNSFYQLPKKETLKNWRDTVPSDFIFSVKASRYITHMKKLKDAEKSLPPLLKRIDVLGDKLGPILFQLPPRWGLNLERLNDFLETLPAGFRYAFEFRDKSWLDPMAYEAMEILGAALCIYDIGGYISPKEITADFIYVRLHGPDGPYRGHYDAKTLSGWAGAFSAWLRQGMEIFCYFDNDERGYAVRNALTLQDMMNK